MADNVLVSVIVPTYNRETYLDFAIQSIVNQTYKNIEIIVVDDGSQYNYAEAICAKYPQCFYYYKENGGLSSARNFGIQKAKGDFIAFLDDDDEFLPEKIEKQCQVLHNNSSVACVHSSAYVIDNDGSMTGEVIGANKSKIKNRSGYVFWNALGAWVVKSPTPLFRKKVFDTILFDESIKVGEDVDFYQRMFYLFSVSYINEPLALYRDNEDPNRLSKKIEKYVGLEYKVFQNFKKMKIQNPIVLHKIAIFSAKAAIRNWNNTYPSNKIKRNRLVLLFNPYYYLKLPITMQLEITKGQNNK
jgi:glycosyltransferase involved in cell wall biosynthesis